MAFVLYTICDAVFMQQSDIAGYHATHAVSFKGKVTINIPQKHKVDLLKLHLYKL